MRPDEIDAQALGFFQNLINHGKAQEAGDRLTAHLEIVTPRTWIQLASALHPTPTVSVDTERGLWEMGGVV